MLSLAVRLMLPTIFGQGIEVLGELTPQASHFSRMAIVGGAIISRITVAIAGATSLAIATSMPAICYKLPAIYGR